MRVVIIGAGGHAQVVADILLRAQEQNAATQVVGYLDNDSTLIGRVLLGLPVLGTIAQLAHVTHDTIVVAVGDNTTRQRLFEGLKKKGERFAIARHPNAVIASDVAIGAGTMICAGVVVNPGSVIGENVILNTGCTIDHHNQISSHVHIGPGVHLGGEVNVGESTLVGIGAIVMPCCHIGAHSIVGAGACVTKSVPAGLTVVGVPAKPI